MKLTKSQLKQMKDLAHDAWLSSSQKDAPDEHLAMCWIKALNGVLAKEGLELYAFEIDHNKNAAPTNLLDPSGKIEL